MRQFTKSVSFMAVTLLLFATSCKKKDDVKSLFYKTFEIEAVNMSGDQEAQAEAMQANTIEFTKKGKIFLKEGENVIEGTYVLNEEATSLTTTMGGKTETFIVSGVSATGMTLIKGEEQMVLKAK